MRMKDRSGVSSVHSHSYLRRRTAESMRPRLLLRVARSESHEDEGLPGAATRINASCLFSQRLRARSSRPAKIASHKVFATRLVETHIRHTASAAMHGFISCLEKRWLLECQSLIPAMPIRIPSFRVARHPATTHEHV